MSVGLIALLDDVASLAKVAAASLDDIAAHTAKATSKSAGVVIDDTAVTPRYVVGFSADRELPIVAKIAAGSLRNKLLILLPLALLLSAFAPWAITPLLMLGGLFLCYEGTEKIFTALLPGAAHRHEAEVGVAFADPEELERQKVRGAIRTDLILSAEIMAIALASIPDTPLVTQLITLTAVAIAMTAGVYGIVALIVRADDAGVALARSRFALLRGFGRALVTLMPSLLAALAGIGTVAMLWVGGGIVVHGLESWHILAPAQILHTASGIADGTGTPLGWLLQAFLASLFGLILGAVLIPLVAYVLAPAWRAMRSLGRR